VLLIGKSQRVLDASVALLAGATSSALLLLMWGGSVYP
jgi:hypothetical protein